MVVWPLYGLASAASIGFAALSPLRDRYHAKMFSVVLAIGWGASNVLYKNDLQTLNPVLDFVIGYIALDLWAQHHRHWKVGVLLCSFLMLICHLVREVALALNFDVGYAYAAALNILFLCQLLLVSHMGMKRGGNIVGGWITDIFGRTRTYALRFSLSRERRQ